MDHFLCFTGPPFTLLWFVVFPLHFTVFRRVHHTQYLVITFSAIALFFLLFPRPPTSPSRCHISSRAHSAHPPGMLTRYGTVVRCWFDGVRERHSRSAGGTSGGGDTFLPLHSFLPQRAARSTSRCSDLVKVPRSSLYCGSLYCGSSQLTRGSHGGAYWTSGLNTG